MKYTVVDGHCDTPMELWLRQENLRSNTCQVSLERAKKLSGYVQFYAFCTVWLEQDGSFEAHYAAALEHFNRQLDENKDQSYVLYNLTQEQLAHTLFPLGELHKDQVRAIAEENGFINAHKRESQDICFVPDGDYAAFIESYTGRHYPPGDFVDTQGNVLGRHKGIIRYTIGQRRGLGLALPAPLYVCKKDPESNTVTLCPNDQLNSTVVRVTEFNWLSIAAPAEPLHAAAKIRYNMHQAPCTVEVLPGGDVQLTFDAPQRAVTPGQAAVIYDGDTVLGGGRIV